jgi:type IV pilus assembly protein PilC
MQFHFKAQKADGEIFEGEREAADKFALFDEIKKEGATMLFAEGRTASKKFWQRKFFSRLVLGSVSIHQKIVFAKNLSAMIAAGLPLSRALSVIERQMNNKVMKKILNNLNEQIKKGKPLSEGLAEFPLIFPPLFVSMTRAGEESGSLSEALNTVSGQLERVYYIQRKLRGALMYPALVISLIIVVGILMFVFVVPKLIANFEGLNITLPWSTQLIIWTSNFLQNHYLIVISIIAIVSVGTSWILKTGKGKRLFDMICLRFPIIGPMVIETNTARAARTLSSLLSSGVNVVEALQITEDVVQNVYFKETLNKAREAIQKGTPLSAPFAENEKIYPAFFAEMVSAGEETGNLAKMLSDVGVFYENEMDQKTKDFSTIIEPLIMIVIGAVVGFFVYAMLTPMYTMMGAIS